MHQDIIPLYAADIQDQLKKQFAYLSGKKSTMFPHVDTAQLYSWACYAFVVSDAFWRTNLSFIRNWKYRLPILVI